MLHLCLCLLQLRVPVTAPFPIRSRDVLVKIQKKHITVGLKGQPPILDGELPHEVKLDDSTWLLEDNAQVVVNFEKVLSNCTEPWRSLRKGTVMRKYAFFYKFFFSHSRIK